MSNDPSLVGNGDLGEVVRHMVADVLMVPIERVDPDSRLVADLGAESIDFLDLIFRLETHLGTNIPPDRWGEFVEERLPGADLTTKITTSIVHEFATREADRESGNP